MFLLYNVLLTLLAPIWVPWMLIRAWRRKEKPNWKERSGELPLKPDKGAKRIWIHAVSVGEVVAATPILRELRTELPEFEIVFSVTTSSGHRTARENAEGLFDHLVYFPMDVARFQLAAMQRVQPKVVAVMETELWYNFLWAAKVFGAATLLVNGRISDRSYPRAKRFRFFYQALLKQVDRCLMQSELDAKRIKDLGAETVEVLGNCKFDQALEGLQTDAKAWRKELALTNSKPVIVIGSTRGESEERFVLEALKTVGFGLIQVIHAPRHIETVPGLAEAVTKAAGAVALRSKGETGPYLVLDTYGELSQIYAVADLVIVGGGFDNLGGQNIIQPLAHGKPVIHGPHMQNFRDVTREAAVAGATATCGTSAELAMTIERLLEDKQARESMASAAATLIQANKGASKRYAVAIAKAARQTAGAKR